MKKFILLAVGYQTPTPEIMEKWMKWFETVKEHMVDGGNPFGPGREVTAVGTKELPLDKEAITGYMIINAKDMDEAQKIAEGCPHVTGMRVYEAMSM